MSRDNIGLHKEMREQDKKKEYMHINYTSSENPRYSVWAAVRSNLRLHLRLLVAAALSPRARHVSTKDEVMLTSFSESSVTVD